MNFKGKDCIIHVPQRLAGTGKRVDNSCKQRAEYFRHTLVIVYMECGRWQVSFILEKSACLAQVSVMEHILRMFSKFPETLGKLGMCKQCVPGSFYLCPRTRVWNEDRIKFATSPASLKGAISRPSPTHTLHGIDYRPDSDPPCASWYTIGH